ncbi:hypothetical protein P154DRAFT_532285 [Amniculicola lignicola CBS 123094]|uniref:Uncharacterized protein n=1 Tax=Amniculicola lignicola CBS 123094 TaxID=1392246 RepID=A0A6A5WR56_9PLEO|nr:hypothetical protein P154DRAFT_532285 [Amniculicola lignicola CBS 123094]
MSIKGPPQPHPSSPPHTILSSPTRGRPQYRTTYALSIQRKQTRVTGYLSISQLSNPPYKALIAPSTTSNSIVYRPQAAQRTCCGRRNAESASPLPVHYPVNDGIHLHSSTTRQIHRVNLRTLDLKAVDCHMCPVPLGGGGLDEGEEDLEGVGGGVANGVDDAGLEGGEGIEDGGDIGSSPEAGEEEGVEVGFVAGRRG